MRVPLIRRGVWLVSGTHGDLKRMRKVVAKMCSAAETRWCRGRKPGVVEALYNPVSAIYFSVF